jgi:hypothetical protein
VTSNQPDAALEMDLETALDATRAAMRRLDELVSSGWRLTHCETAGVVEGTGEPDQLLQAITALAPLLGTTTELTGVFAKASLTLRISQDGEVIPVGPGHGDILENFDVDDRTDAELAWSGDVEAALRLPGAWSCRAQLRWTAALEQAVPQTQWLLFPHLDGVIEYLHGKPFWQLSSELDVTRGTVALVRRLGPDASLTTPALSILSLDEEDVTPPMAHLASAGATTDALLSSAIAPRLLMPTEVIGGSVAPAAQALWSLVVATCWARIATALVPDTATGSVEVEYFGLQRVRYALSRGGPACTRDTAEKSLELLEWVESAGTVDRLLAVRQVASLRTDQPPWERAADIRTAAEPIFMALRSDAVAEALKAVRDTRAGALETARRTVESTTYIAKSTVERALGSVIALGGIFLANTTKNITPSQAGDLRLLVACTLFGLVLWHLVVERPALFRPIRDFKADLPSLSELLPPDEQTRISELKSLGSATRYATLLAWLVPVLYIVLALASLFVNRH